MKTYCITPIYDPDVNYLKQNIESVRSQTVKTQHLLVFDGIPKNKEELYDNIDFTGIEVIELPKCHSDYGDTPRALGAISAFNRDADAVFWLDDDNWIEPNHAKIMTQELSNNFPITTCQRNICTLEGEIMGLCFETNPNQFIDMNCYMIHKSVKNICSVLWLMNPEHHIFDDKVLFANIKQNKIPFKYYDTPTVNYRTNFNFHYQHYGFPIPESSKDGVGVQYARKHGQL